MDKDKFSIEFEAVQDYIDTRTQITEGGGVGGGGTMNHSELEQLDYESSGHTGFASIEDLYEQTDVFADMVAESEESVLGVIGEPEEGTLSADIASLKASVSAVEDKLNTVINKIFPNPDVDPEVPSYIPEYYVLATDEDFSGTMNGNFVYTGSDEYVIIPYRIKGVVVRSAKGMFKNKPVLGVASYSPLIYDWTEAFSYAGVQGQPLELNYLDMSGAADLTKIFYYCKAGTLDLSSWDTNHVVQLNSAFCECEASTIDVSGWDTSKVVSMYYCFNYSSATFIVGLGDWTNEMCRNYEQMFRSASVRVLDLSGFSTPLAGSYSDMLRYASVLEAYAKTQEDAYWFNSTSSLNKTSGYTFTVKEGA